MADETKHPSKIETLSALIEQSGLTYKIFDLMLDVLREHEQQLYACREDLKLARATCASADRRSGEAMYKLSEVLQELRKTK